MITKKDLEEIARLKGLALGNAEKDYLIDIALLSISKNTKNELVFKGGTCLYKFHKLNRFSEDMDFSATAKINVDGIMDKVISDFKKFGINAKLYNKREPYNSVLINLRVEGPLYSGRPVSYAKIGVDINLKSKVILETETLSYNPIYQEIPAVNVLCMKPEEIFAEKVRALITRKRARDLFDLNFLIENKNCAAKEIIEEKMKYYDLGFNVKTLISGINALKNQWEKELKGFVLNLPTFDAVRDRVVKQINKLYK